MIEWYTPDGALYEGCTAAVGSPMWDKAHRQIEKDLRNPKLKFVARTKLKNFLVSTVWLGLDHNHMGRMFRNGNHTPLIFETMVFRKEVLPGRFFGEDVDQVRYATKSDAEIGHKKMVEKWRKAR